MHIPVFIFFIEPIETRSKPADLFEARVGIIALSFIKTTSIIIINYNRDWWEYLDQIFIIKLYKMLNLNNVVSNKNENKDNNWPFRMLIIGPSGSGKTNVLLHLINNLHPIDKIYLYAKDIHEPKYEYLINKREQAGIKNFSYFHRIFRRYE